MGFDEGRHGAESAGEGVFGVSGQDFAIRAGRIAEHGRGGRRRHHFPGWWSRRSIRLGGRRRCPSRMGEGLIGLGPVFEVIQNPLHERRILDASGDFHGATALITRFDAEPRRTRRVRHQPN